VRVYQRPNGKCESDHGDDERQVLHWPKSITRPVSCGSNSLKPLASNKYGYQRLA
jgi:hypothetical protein